MIKLACFTIHPSVLRLTQDPHVSSNPHTYSMRLTYLVGTYVDLNAIASSRHVINDIREISTRIILGDPNVEFVLLDPGIQEEINSYPELQADWSRVAPLYWDAMALYRRRSTHTHAQSAQDPTQPTSTISPAARAQARSSALLHDLNPRHADYAGPSRKW